MEGEKRAGGGYTDLTRAGEQLPAIALQGKAVEVRASPCAVPVLEGK